MAEKIRTTAKVINGKIYLDQQSRKHLTDWMEANEKEISSYPIGVEWWLRSGLRDIILLVWI
ncbi:MAG: hypothetical protein MRECE_18c008 [Mycoplasmataceae bacterium CE_OT135]|nr:MAG: hypothetical protein MRECE_29c008 [Mycoplasmataceae bacterium CE_OT135]KLL03362.1 MAG: hypothetical protein MRECE_18c008 [Mycoplasmataceae bacterium CE_OT135]